MTLAELSLVVGIAVMISSAITGALMYFAKRKEVQLSGKSVDGEYNLDLNTSIDIANKRAREAETERRNAEVLHKQEMAALREEWRKDNEVLRASVVAMENELKIIKKSLAYKITLIANLGTETIEKVQIERLPV
jgi:ABC-type Fe3+-citrate transport system substrate-binding protein